MKVVGVVMVITPIVAVLTLFFLWQWWLGDVVVDLVGFLVDLPPMMSLLMSLSIALLPMWSGVLLFQAAGGIKAAVAADDERALREPLAKLKTFFVLQGILCLIWLVAAAGGAVYTAWIWS